MRSQRSQRLVRKIALVALSLWLGSLVNPWPGATTEKTVAQIVEEHGKGILLVVNLGPGKTLQGHGSGFVVRPNGVFVTNFHVVEGATALAARLADGREFAVTGIVALKPELDLAVLKVEAQRLPVVTLGDSDAVKVVRGT